MSWHPAGLPGAGWLMIAGLATVAVAGMPPDEPEVVAVPSLTQGPEEGAFDSLRA